MLMPMLVLRPVRLPRREPDSAPLPPPPPPPPYMVLRGVVGGDDEGECTSGDDCMARVELGGNGPNSDRRGVYIGGCGLLDVRGDE